MGVCAIYADRFYCSVGDEEMRYGDRLKTVSPTTEVTAGSLHVNSSGGTGIMVFYMV